MSDERETVPLSAVAPEVAQAAEPVLGARPLEVPLLVLADTRRSAAVLALAPPEGVLPDYEALGPLASTASLASTETGFLQDSPPVFRFDGPLGLIADVCRVAGAEIVRHDRDAFRSWFKTQAGRFPPVAELWREARRLSPDDLEALLVPLIYLNHMWRQGNPEDEPVVGPSAMPEPLHELLVLVADEVGAVPRFSQIVMTMMAWQLDGVAEREPVTYRELVSLDRMRHPFWLNNDNQSELDLYRSFYAVEAFGAPLYGWGAYALECAANDDQAGGTLALTMVRATLRNVYTYTKMLIPRIDAHQFRRLQVTFGWVGDEVNGVASGYQLPFMLMLDALFHVNYRHDGVVAARANNLRFVPEHWKSYFRMIYNRQPALKSWVHESGNEDLAAAYVGCVELFGLFRQMHRHLGGQVIKGGTTTGRIFADAKDNYEKFMAEMGALVADTNATGDLATPVLPDSPAAAASRGERR
ncbi:hypothetical protein [Saccharothrix obliqua]|uniref:hypothetical protein n=1 Tax=Saccharothrix obliqua TaxID=2861747 RepID=UPI001C6062A6|nr:hypothetical protein [Saccharothrix obliqua]MBW4721388.1 hypothetical protein [Saccharothrix obliqua]